MKNHPRVDLKAIARAAMEKYGFIPGFPRSVLREVDAVSERVFSDGRNDPEDLRSLLRSSLDNDDSQDLYQLEVCERGLNGEIRVRVAIADVDACPERFADGPACSP